MRRRLSRDDETADQETASAMASLATAFVQGVAEETGLSLGWTESDAARLDDLCEAFLRSRPSKAVKHSMIMSMGAYLGELIIRNTRGRWRYHRARREAVFLTADDLEGYPHSKVAKRLDTGPEHNLLAYYVYAVRHEVLPDAVLKAYEDKNEH